MLVVEALVVAASAGWRWLAPGCGSDVGFEVAVPRPVVERRVYLWMVGDVLWMAI